MSFSTPAPGYRITGTWDEHASYSYGGTDYPTPYGTWLPAPAAGTLIDNGWVGSAGRRATLRLDEPVEALRPPSPTRMLDGYVEAEGPLVAVCYQHLSERPREGHYDAGQADMVRTGASANGLDYGGDVHVHIHGYDTHGNRIDITRFIGATPAGGDAKLINQEEDMRLRFITRDTQSPWFVTDGLTKRLVKDYAEAQLLVDAGVAVFEDKPGKVNIVGDLVDRIRLV